MLKQNKDEEIDFNRAKLFKHKAGSIDDCLVVSRLKYFPPRRHFSLQEGYKKLKHLIAADEKILVFAFARTTR